MTISMSNATANQGHAVYESDDIASLATYLEAAPFHYVDVATQQAYLAALGKWPLLAEIAAGRNTGERGSE